MPIGFSTIANALPPVFAWTEVGLTCLVLVLVSWMLWRRRAGPRFVAQRGLFALLMMQLLIYVAEYAWLIRDYQHNPLRQYLLPPYNPYMLDLMIRSFGNLLVAWSLAGIIFVALSWLMQKRKQAEMLNVRDLVLITLTIGAAGWPAGLLFLGLIFLFTLVGMIGLVMVRKRSVTDRLVISPFILPAAITTILLKGYLLEWTQLKGIQI